MMADNILDDSPEMALDDPRIAEFLETGKVPGAEPPQEKPDVKAKPPVSSAVATEKDPDAGEAAEDDEPTLKAQIKGLTAELGRRRGNAERVEELEQEIAALKTKKAEAVPSAPDLAWIGKLDDDGLSSKQTDWDDELADARAKYGRAEENSDDRAMDKAGQRILQAKRVLTAFRKETLDRTKRVAEESQTATQFATSIRSEIAEMREAVSELVPDFTEQGSEAWTAGNTEYENHPVLMSQLGPVGEIVAAAMAIVRNPDLLGKHTSSAARKTLIGSLEKSVKKSLSTGASAKAMTPTVDHAAAVSSPEGLANFNAMIERMKGG